MKHYKHWLTLFWLLTQLPLQSSAQVTTPFEDHFNDTLSESNWHHTQDFRGGAFFHVIDGQFVRVPDGGFVFYYNNSFAAGIATYEFKAMGWWVFCWRGTTNPSGGKVVLIGNAGENGANLDYNESIWWPLDSGVYNYHNGSIIRQVSTYVGDFLRTDLNTYRIVDDGTHAMIYVNDQLILDVVLTPEWKNDGYIEIGANHQEDRTAFDDIVVTGINPGPIFNPAPTLTSVIDVPHDDGGKISLFWTSSHLDTNTTILPYYSVWRALPQGQLVVEKSGVTINAISENFNGEAYRTKEIEGTLYAWEWIGNQPAHRFAEYSFIAPTLYDSMSTTDGKHYFLISAHTNDPNVFYDSNVDSGYSVDNLAPLAPMNIAGSYIQERVLLHWDANQESDIRNYVIYRGSHPDSLNFLATSKDTLFIDSTPVSDESYYGVSAQDVHDNESPKTLVLIMVSSEREDDNILNAFALSQNYPNPFNPLTTIKYTLPQASFVTLNVYNTLGQMAMLLVDGKKEAGNYEVNFDASGLQSGVYFYRLVAGDFISTKKFVLLK